VARRTTAEERQKRNRGFTRSTRIELIGEMPTLPNAPPPRQRKPEWGTRLKIS